MSYLILLHQTYRAIIYVKIFTTRERALEVFLKIVKHAKPDAALHELATL